MAIFSNNLQEAVVLTEIANLQPQEPIIFNGMPSKHTLAYAASFPNHIYINLTEEEIAEIATLETYSSRLSAVFLPFGSSISYESPLPLRYLKTIKTEEDLSNFHPEEGKRYDLVLTDYDLVHKVELYSKEPLEYLEPGIAVAKNRIYIHYLTKSSYNPFLV